MTDEQIALARRAVACNGWKWLPGMRWCSQTSLGRSYQRLLDHEVDDFPPYYGVLPDLTDPATLGCLLALVREAWGNKHLWVEAGVDPAMWSLTVYRLGWACVNGEVPPPDIRAESEAEALVAALEAAPKRGEHRREE